MPEIFARLNKSQTTPYMGVLVSSIIIAALICIGDIRVTWSFSAFSVLIYYAITNLSALKLPKKERMFPKWIAVIGLLSCLFLAFWVPREVWLIGIGLIISGFFWRVLMKFSH